MRVKIDAEKWHLRIEVVKKHVKIRDSLIWGLREDEKSRGILTQAFQKCGILHGILKVAFMKCRILRGILRQAGEKYGISRGILRLWRLRSVAFHVVS